MTHTQWIKLTPEEQNWRVVECRGGKWWHLLPFDANKKSLAMPGGHQGLVSLEAAGNEEVCQIYWLPDHLHDLNAMADAIYGIKVHAVFRRYQEILIELRGGNAIWAIDAPAADRAEAFVRAVMHKGVRS